MLSPIDLRSDTVTRPSEAMRRVIAAAEVGDDQWGEDPSILRLQAVVAERLGKESALWFPTGTMTNQTALRLLTRPGDEVIVSRESHAVWHEAGASGRNAGVQFNEIGENGVFTAETVAAAIKPLNHPSYPPTTLIEIENTHNRAGGVIFPQAEAAKICAIARQRGIATFLDGARLWNAAVATGLAPATIAAPFDLVTVCLSKGLGAPAGSLLAGPRELIERAVRERRMLGGAMRQVGLLAAAGQYALEHNLERMAEDHANAREMAGILVAGGGVLLDPASVRTNILVFDLAPGAPDAATVVQRAQEQGVLIFAFGVRRIRAVTHLDVTAAQCRRAAQILSGIIAGG